MIQRAALLWTLSSASLSVTLPANLTTYTILSLFSLYVEPAPHLLSPSWTICISSLQITNRSFRYASPYLWNQPPSFRQPHSVHSPPGSPHPAHITSSQSSPLLSPSMTPSVFHSRLKTRLFLKSFPPYLFLLLPDCFRRS